MAGLFDDPDASPAPPPPDIPAGPSLFGEEAPAPSPDPTPAYRVLARKYRPTGFNDLIGQDAMVRTLRNAFAQDRVAQAFLLTGVRGVGKTTTARIIARALNCVGADGQGGPTADPCGVCHNCLAILADRHPDVIEMDAASNNGVDDARELRDLARFRPMQGRYKVFYLDECHMLSTAAWNALLKTLEEPPPYLKFVFATTELRKVPVTVLSRCQRFDLRRVPMDRLTALYAEIAGKEGIAAEPLAIEAVARAADGSVRDGLSLLDQAIAQAGGGAVTAELVTDMLGLADRSALFDLFEAVMQGRVADALAILDAQHARGADPATVLRDLLGLVHTLTRLKSVPDLAQGNSLPELERTRGAALAESLPIPALARAWQMLLKGGGEVQAAPEPRAALDMLLIRLAHVADVPPPGELVKRLLADGPAAAPPPPARPPGSGAGGGGMRAVANGAPVVQAAPAPDPTPAPASAAPRLASFRDVVALAAEHRRPLLHANLLHEVRLVRFAPPVIEINPSPRAPRELARDLAGLLLEVTGTRWTVAVSAAPGEPTIAEQSAAADTARRTAAADHPIVRAILDVWPGATIESVHDETADRYGLPVQDAEIDAPDFAPPDAEPADMDDEDDDR